MTTAVDKKLLIANSLGKQFIQESDSDDDSSIDELSQVEAPANRLPGSDTPVPMMDEPSRLRTQLMQEIEGLVSKDQPAENLQPLREYLTAAINNPSHLPYIPAALQASSDETRSAVYLTLDSITPAQIQALLNVTASGYGDYYDTLKTVLESMINTRNNDDTQAPAAKKARTEPTEDRQGNTAIITNMSELSATQPRAQDSESSTEASISSDRYYTEWSSEQKVVMTCAFKTLQYLIKHPTAKAPENDVDLLKKVDEYTNINNVNFMDAWAWVLPNKAFANMMFHLHQEQLLEILPAAVTEGKFKGDHGGIVLMTDLPQIRGVVTSQGFYVPGASQTDYLEWLTPEKAQKRNCTFMFDLIKRKNNYSDISVLEEFYKLYSVGKKSEALRSVEA